MSTEPKDLLLGLALGAMLQARDEQDPDKRFVLDQGADMFMELVDGKGPEGAIERQEKKGQQQLVSRDYLPVDAPWEQLEQLGFKRVGEVDRVLCEATLPEGWEKRASDHSMWSYIHDEKGRKRAAVFYKAAFYDRSAHLSLQQRYGCGTRPVGGWSADSDIYEGFVQDCGVDIHVSESKITRPSYETGTPEEFRAHREAEEALGKEARAWLTERYPDWTDPLTYWN